MGQRAPAPQRHRHHHRPVISFKELGMRTKQRAESRGALPEQSPPGSFILPIDLTFNRRHRLTAHCLVLTVRYPDAQSPSRLLRYKDRKASAAETCPAPKPPGKSGNRALPHRRQLRRSFSAADGSARDPANPSTTAVRNSSFCQGTCAAPDPSKAAATTVAQLLPIPASDKFARIRRSSW